MKVLHGMGCAQELSRSMSKFSNFAISFSIICILSGGINSFAQAISSAFPTAGGLYQWASILGSRFWGWLTAWLNLLGLITVLGAINFGTVYFFAGTFGPTFGFSGTDWQIVGFVAVITIIQAIFNHIGIKATTFLTDISGYIIFATTAVLVLACVYFAPAIDISRDDGVPGFSKALATVSPKYRTPVNAIWTSAVLCILYVMLALSIKVAGTSIYVIVVNSALVFLFLSFTIPLIAAMVNYGGPKWPNPGP